MNLSKLRDSTFFIPALVVLAVVVGLYFFAGLAFWESFFSNFLATLLGAIVGIPTAIWLTNRQRIKDDAAQRAKIVPLLQEELLVNTVQLSGWQKSQIQKLETLYTGIFLQDDAWTTFSASGELAFIHDAQLLKKLGHAYNSIRIVRSLSERYVGLAHLDDQDERDYLLEIIGRMLVKGIDEALADIRVAFLAIGKES